MTKVHNYAHPFFPTTLRELVGDFELPHFRRLAPLWLQVPSTIHMCLITAICHSRYSCVISAHHSIDMNTWLIVASIRMCKTIEGQNWNSRPAVATSKFVRFTVLAAIYMLSPMQESDGWQSDRIMMEGTIKIGARNQRVQDVGNIVGRGDWHEHLSLIEKMKQQLLQL